MSCLCRENCLNWTAVSKHLLLQAGADLERARSIASYPLTQLSDSDADDQEPDLQSMHSTLKDVAPETLGAVPLLRVLLDMLQKGHFFHAFALWHSIPQGNTSMSFVIA